MSVTADDVQDLFLRAKALRPQRVAARQLAQAEPPQVIALWAPSSQEGLRCRAFLDRVQALLVRRPSQAGDAKAPAPVVARSTREVPLNEVRGLLTKVENIFKAEAKQLAATMDQWIGPMVGVPLPVAPFEVLGAGDSERAFQSTLRWVLDQNGTHDLGDRFLRRFLARVQLTLGDAVFDFSRTLDATILCEFQWDTSGLGLLREADRSPADALRCDLVIVCPPHLVAVELKVGAAETLYCQSDGVSISQAALYTAAFNAFVSRKQRAPSTSERAAAGVPLGASSVDAARWTLGHIERIAQAAERHSEAARSMLRCARAYGVLLHMNDACALMSEVPEGHSGIERGVAVRHLDWRDVAEILADVIQTSNPRPDVVLLLRGFIEAIYAECGDTPKSLIHDVEEARLRVGEPRVLDRFPIRSRLELLRLKKALSGRAPCCDDQRYKTRQGD